MADKPVKLVCENCLLEILESEDYEPLYDDEADGDPVAHSDMATCIARLREELRVVSRYAARLHDAADDLIHLNTADERVRAAADRAVLFALYPGCVRHGDISETVGDDPCAGCGEEGCEVRVWHAALKRGREDE